MTDEEQSWQVVWSKQFPRVAAIAHYGDGVIVAAGTDVICIDAGGNTRWKSTFPFAVYSIGISDETIGLLCGQGFHLLNIVDGTPLHEGRSTTGGFNGILPRVGGGWVLSDRVGHLHLFNGNGVGVRRVNVGSIRRLIGCLDREHLLLQDEKGHLRCLRLVQQDSDRMVDERIWSWMSELHDGHLLAQSTDGEIWVGVPHPFGWDELQRIETIGMEPLASTRTADGWWGLELQGNLCRLPPIEHDAALIGGEHLCGNRIDRIVTSTRGGLLRWWEAPHLAVQRRAQTRQLVAEEKQRMDWEHRAQIFHAARKAEDEGILSKAVELYQTLGRSEDVRRILEKQREGN
ncbi:MAG: hypothetical protein HOF90_05265 [Euryarchaeota archaeon]|nr:hypothetical protein [Euryarchaeota archaeon]